jgi:hypothetical protein
MEGIQWTYPPDPAPAKSNAGPQHRTSKGQDKATASITVTFKRKNEKERNTTKKRYDSVPNLSFVRSLSNYIYIHLAKIDNNLRTLRTTLSTLRD